MFVQMLILNGFEIEDTENNQMNQLAQRIFCFRFFFNMKVSFRKAAQDSPWSIT